ncbi:GMP reductase [Fructilactobacillus lindneri]|uniref:GMP reductase n=2 Tax=Fructilactobacillus lindneri TaxID=53444 RepID=A0A0R2JM82_9LACO|nr:GMP reductase [Fructilactobacillus lindneri]ANZ57537.1 guanosine monophosphate reductase [Fructilactobacillus lindneri]ANZ58805.1 guanosine monophosphate reductase [Fructilactobacillus lindneri]KRN78280.1 guanosine 5-monophosphate oxidoreductase [Fructilactobacillus lindneri DSM 20690 = JCM 11027]POG97702.1 GMP reductase [Fructilactobacillus lindneri]POH00089.1 GMP reductase [Fructilactobacillus lindneri]
MEVFDYDDIQLIPNKCIVNSRSECNTEVEFGGRKFKLPVVPANMQTVINEDLAISLASNGYFYVMHRFQPEKRHDFVKRMHDKDLFASISVGVKPGEYEFIDSLAVDDLVPEYITIDIADGYADSVINMIHYIKDKLPTAFVIAGNVGTPEGVRALENAGADATKVGIGPGKACITKIKTGFGTGGWQLAAIRYCAKAAQKPIVADGGIRNDGDIAKSVRFGATMCMIGSMFAGHQESPGEEVEKDGKKYKEYFGSASQFQKGAYRNVEGKKLLVPFKGSIYDTLNEMQEDLQSSISYAGGRDLNALGTVDYVIVKNTIYNGD